MKMASKPTIKNDMRMQYERADFGVMQRGEFYGLVVKATTSHTNVVNAFPLLDPVGGSVSTKLAITGELKRPITPPKRIPKPI
jgi:hypothetical protein